MIEIDLAAIADAYAVWNFLRPVRTWLTRSARTHLGTGVGRGVTPIERAIAGEPADRRRRYEHRLAKQGVKRVALSVRAEHAEFFRELAALSRAGHPDAWTSLMEDPAAFLAEVRAMLTDD